jgi:mono/diheme cytochrome c family protein
MKWRIAVLAGAALLLALVARGQDAGDLFAIGHGRALYLTHCVGCHGALGLDASGNPVRGQEDPPAPDLALIVVRDGAFDVLHVANHIGGRTNALNPARTMPRWSKQLAVEWPADEAMAAVKVFWLTQYLESLQQTSGDVRR